MALLFQTLITRCLGYKLRLRALYYKKVSELRVTIFNLALEARIRKNRITQRIGRTMTSWLYVALNTVTAYSFTSVKSTSSASVSKVTTLLRKTRQTLGRLLLKLRGK